MSTTLVLVLLLSHNPTTRPIKIPITILKVDRLEINSYFQPETGQHIFDQMILYNFKYNNNTFQYNYEISDYRTLFIRPLATNEERRIEQKKLNAEYLKYYPKATIIPIWNPELPIVVEHIGDRYYFFFIDRKYSDRRYLIIARLYQNTETYYDTELEARKILPEEKRKPLLHR